MQIFIASDHAGIDLKNAIQLALKEYQWTDLGPFDTNSVDYPDYADLVCKNVLSTTNTMGLLICGSGQGMSIRANKYSKIRAALCWSSDIAELSRKHNDANILCLGARFLNKDQAIEIARKFYSTQFEGGRHQQRVDKLSSVSF